VRASSKLIDFKRMRKHIERQVSSFTLFPSDEKNERARYVSASYIWNKGVDAIPSASFDFWLNGHDHL